jgi:hypothetical protein
MQLFLTSMDPLATAQNQELIIARSDLNCRYIIRCNQQYDRTIMSIFTWASIVYAFVYLI